MKFIARQPILNLQQEVFAYELLFRSGTQNSCEGLSMEHASSLMVDTSFLIGLQRLTEGRRAFINCSREFLLGEFTSLFPRDRVVVEILETIEPDEDVIVACQRLKHDGYQLALDDFVETSAWEPLIKLADFIKVDFRLSSREEQLSLAQRHRPRGIVMLAEKVETPEEFELARQMGYTLFQGYFFCKPEILQQREIPSFKLAYLDLMQAAAAPHIDIKQLAAKVKHEASITYKLLRYLNSAAFGLSGEIRSIQHALALLGERDLRKWIAVVCMGVMGSNKPDELLTLPLIRGRFCELLAPLVGKSKEQNNLFMLGLLSLMDAILDLPLDVVLQELPVGCDIKEGLLEQDNGYHDILNLVIAHERADWEAVGRSARRQNINEELLSPLYSEAVDWAVSVRHGQEMHVNR